MANGAITDRDHLLDQSAQRFPAAQVTLDANQRQLLRSALQISVLVVAGATPVLSIPVHILGLVDIHDTGRFFALPLLAVAVALALTRTVEATWALRGLVAGLAAVTCYDAFRAPFIVSGIWPDFIPRLGGWIVGSNGTDVGFGYLWRYLGDGGGMGVVFFLACALFGVKRGTARGRHVVALAVGYGIFIWSGLIATVTLIPRGSTMLFTVTLTSLVLSLVGHLVYGAVLGLGYRHVLHRKGTPSS